MTMLARLEPVPHGAGLSGDGMVMVLARVVPAIITEPVE